MSETPCPAHVRIEGGARRYCEVGPAGHAGSHVGDRTEAEYDRLLVAADDGMGPAYPDDPAERVRLLVCSCGTIAKGWAGARCGRDLRRNIRWECPALWWWYELLPPDEQEAMEGSGRS